MAKHIFDLKPEQQKAFNRFKNAYKKCIDVDIFFVNNYGSLQAYDSNLICGYGDFRLHAKGVSEISVLDAGETLNEIKIPGEWSDDQHYFGLTDKGDEVYFKNS